MFPEWIESFWIESEFYCDTFSHFFCCFIRKCYTKNRSRLNSLWMNHRNHSFGDSMCFSRSRSSIDQKWSKNRFYSFELLRIELCHKYKYLRKECIEKREKSEQKSEFYIIRFPIRIWGFFSCFCSSFPYTARQLFLYIKNRGSR